MVLLARQHKTFVRNRSKSLNKESKGFFGAPALDLFCYSDIKDMVSPPCIICFFCCHTLVVWHACTKSFGHMEGSFIGTPAQDLFRDSTTYFEQRKGGYLARQRKLFSATCNSGIEDNVSPNWICFSADILFWFRMPPQKL